MQISSPFSISSRLLPALSLDTCTLSLEPLPSRTPDGRARCALHFDFTDGTPSYTDDSLSSGVGASPSIAEWFETALSFLGACAESFDYSARTGRAGGNADLFPPPIASWASEHSDEISLLALELSEAPSSFFS